MKKHLLSLMLLLIVIGAGVVSVKAQSSTGIRANVPFDFIVGDQTFKAGKITVRRTLVSGNEPLMISSSDYRTRTSQLTRNLQSTSRSDSAKLVFRRYGDRYYLAQVWTSGDNGSELSKSRSERALEREMRHLAKNVREPEVITIIATMQ